MANFGEHRDSSFGDNLESVGVARLSQELTDQKQEIRQLKETNAKLTKQLFGLQDRYIQSNDRLYEEMKTPTRGDGKVKNLNNNLKEKE